MALWFGATWECERCQWVNAEIRRRCRNCGRFRHPGLIIQGPEDDEGQYWTGRCWATRGEAKIYPDMQTLWLTVAISPGPLNLRLCRIEEE